MERHVLVVYPHPDDETFASGGTIALHTRAGTPVTYLCGTLGQMGRNMGKPFFANRETLPDVREKELRAACAALGIQDLRLLGLRDKTVEFEDPEALADRILAVMKEVRPSLLITYYPGFAVHPDHNALGAAAIRAVEKLPADERPVVHCSAFSRDCREKLGDPDVIIDITSVRDVKMAAIRAHRSQSEAMLARMERDPAFRAVREATLRQEVYWTYRV
ncbi:bacillithiol biosynthesis deacetylase BshB2 [Alicyclobacillus macrosporangiidus]|jgi:bacillithiol biosynthesis deacetylase BshB2|uniref:Bacillithiol biosynthesis deacetylase BshB2 n=1 Tax=Alicyclobacillus macrosporangiidus TaxID=392015 RepID=A0A1I7F8W6_9BACL|nr:bacillithiol biosynthesis deacetylase BshB2 [Alicyclobacillus macrosporangiidus]SFU32620.1 bacillithiol biosynthesis deacetylase BshB2 [Alicyclobacillus macrosporangiidus]